MCWPNSHPFFFLRFLRWLLLSTWLSFVKLEETHWSFTRHDQSWTAFYYSHNVSVNVASHIWCANCWICPAVLQKLFDGPERYCLENRRGLTSKIGKWSKCLFFCYVMFKWLSTSNFTLQFYQYNIGHFPIHIEALGRLLLSRYRHRWAFWCCIYVVKDHFEGAFYVSFILGVLSRKFNRGKLKSNLQNLPYVSKSQASYLKWHV